MPKKQQDAPEEHEVKPQVMRSPKGKVIEGTLDLTTRVWTPGKGGGLLDFKVDVLMDNGWEMM